MSTYEVGNAVDHIDKSMTTLRDAMKGIQIRNAGFKKDHDELARAVANYTVLLTDAVVLVGADGPSGKKHK